MRKLVRSKTSLCFLTRNDTWTPHFEDADVFTLDEAIAAARRFASDRLEIYYSFETDRPTPYDFTHPLGQELPELGS